MAGPEKNVIDKISNNLIVENCSENVTENVVTEAKEKEEEEQNELGIEITLNALVGSKNTENEPTMKSAVCAKNEVGQTPPALKTEKTCLCKEKVLNFEETKNDEDVAIKNVSKAESKENLNECSLACRKLTLSEACKSGDVSLVKKLLDTSDCDINAAVDGWSCLHDACMRECQFSEITNLLLEHGADVNLQDELGNTPLHTAIIYHCLDNVKLLLQHKADTLIVNNGGASAIDTAINVKDNEILELLGQRPIKERVKRRRRVKKELSDVALPDLCSPPILKKRKLECTPETTQCAKRVKFNEC